MIVIDTECCVRKFSEDAVNLGILVQVAQGLVNWVCSEMKHIILQGVRVNLQV